MIVLTKEMAIWIAICIGYAATVLAAIEEIRMDRPLKKLAKELGGL